MKKQHVDAVSRSQYNISSTDNYFELFGIQTTFDLDTEEIAKIRKVFLSQVHPDKYATASISERSASLHLATRINEAYQHLQNPLLRANHICRLAGVDLRFEQNTSFEQDFLHQQMHWHEMLEGARTNKATYIRLKSELEKEYQNFYGILKNLLDEKKQFTKAAQKIREWKFVDKLISELHELS